MQKNVIATVVAAAVLGFASLAGAADDVKATTKAEVKADSKAAKADAKVDAKAAKADAKIEATTK